MDVVAEESQEEWLGIQDQASGGVQVSMEAEVSHCPNNNIAQNNGLIKIKR